MKYNFIKTLDVDIKDKLVKKGYTFISQINGVHTFIYNDKLTFDDVDMSKIQLSNMFYL